MPTTEWLKKEFDYGYDSGNVLGLLPNKVRRSEEKRIGGSYRRVFKQAILPFLKPDSRVMELGPGNGAWSRAILQHIPNGKLITVDYQDVTQWLDPEQFEGRLECHQVNENSFSCIEDGSIDFFWSMGVLCHNNQKHIGEILRNARPKLKPGKFACHQYANWDKLEQYGWRRGGVPAEFQQMADDEIWWPRNNQMNMVSLSVDAGWTVVRPDLKLLQRDGVIQLRNASSV
ncbi:MAG: class I SAM-dependent methyltransferase [Mariniblastus sp.]|nr:class I SAM-dependent methyltransferase [Mariniblastus sp.]